MGESHRFVGFSFRNSSASAATAAAEAPAAPSRYYSATPAGAAVAAVDGGGGLSPYLHDVLVLCAAGVWLDELRQFMPPRSLEQTLKTLEDTGLVAWRVREREGPDAQAQVHAVRAALGRLSGFDQLSAA